MISEVLTLDSDIVSIETLMHKIINYINLASLSLRSDTLHSQDCCEEPGVCRVPARCGVSDLITGGAG